MKRVNFTGALARRKCYSKLLNLWDTFLPNVPKSQRGKSFVRLPQRSLAVMAAHIKSNMPYLEMMPDKELNNVVLNGPPRIFSMCCGSTVSFVSVANNSSEEVTIDHHIEDGGVHEDDGATNLIFTRNPDALCFEPWGFHLTYDVSRGPAMTLPVDDVGNSSTSAAAAADGAPVPAAPIPVKVIILEPSPSNDFAGLFAPFERQDPVNALLVGVEVGGNHHHGDGSVVNQTSLDNLVQRATRLHLRLPSASVMSSAVYAKRPTSSQSRDAARAAEDHSKETTTPLLDDDVGVSKLPQILRSRKARCRDLGLCYVTRQGMKSPSPTERNPIERIVHLHGNLFRVTLRVPEEENQQRNSSQKERPNTPPLPSVFRLRRKDSQFVYVEGMSNAQRMAMARCVADFTPQTQQKQSTEVNSPHQEVLDASTSCRRATGELLIDQVLRPRVRKSKKSTMKRDLSALFSSKDPPKKLVLVCELHLKTSSTFV